MRVVLNIDEEDTEFLVRQGIMSGYKREYPNKAWTWREKRQCAELAIKMLAKD